MVAEESVGVRRFCCPGGTDPVDLLARGVSERVAVVVEGAVGVGKTSLVRLFAEARGKTPPDGFIPIQLGEQTDSKSLFGYYSCTEVPSDFRWEDGPITKAMRKGAWLLLEDVDKAPAELLSSLVELTSERRLEVRGREEVAASEDFQIFATIRTGGRAEVDRSKEVYLRKLWFRVSLTKPSVQEMTRMIGSNDQKLSYGARKVSQVFAHISNAMVEAHCSRHLGIRDLMKWCKRMGKVSGGLDDRIRLFREAVDVLLTFVSGQDLLRKLRILLAAELGVPEERVDYFENVHKPDIKIGTKSIRVGRTSVPKSSVSNKTQMKYCLTRPASQLLERIGMCVEMKEPVLLVGETGCGKTASVQFLASHCGQRLHVINMSQQSDSADLLGGFKPVTLSVMFQALKNEYMPLFRSTFLASRNEKFLGNLDLCLRKNNFSDFLKLLRHPAASALNKNLEKRLRESWRGMLARIDRLLKFVQKGNVTTAFTYLEGVLLKAAQTGEWVLLDEINMAVPESLSCLHALLDGPLFHAENRSNPIRIHDNFRLFACMNPAGDTGKAELVPGIRNRFTEFFVKEAAQQEDLLLLVQRDIAGSFQSYLEGLSVSPRQTESIVKLYICARKKAPALASAVGKTPCYSLRTLCRALTYASRNDFGNVQRSIYEAVSMSFLTEVEGAARAEMEGLINRCLVEEKAMGGGFLHAPVPEPKTGKFVKVEGYWVKCGGDAHVDDPHYTITSTVRRNLKDVARILSAQTFPVLIEGETSVGKTSLVELL